MAEIVTTRCLSTREILEQADSFLSAPGHWVKQDYVAWRPAPNHRDIEVMGACMLGAMVLVDIIDTEYLHSDYHAALQYCRQFIEEDQQFSMAVRHVLQAMDRHRNVYLSNFNLIRYGLNQITSWNDNGARCVSDVHDVFSDAIKLAVADEERVDG